MSNFVVVLLLMVPGGAVDPQTGPQRLQKAATLSPRDIANKAIEAHGGADKLGRFKATMTTVHGKLHEPSRTAVFTGRSADELPARQWYDYNVELPDGRKIQLIGAVDGNHEWTTIGGVDESYNKDEMMEVREGLHDEYVATLRPLLDQSVTLASAGETQIDGKPAVGIVVTVKGHRPVQLYFDKTSWLLVKSQCRQKNIQTDRFYIREVFFSRYRPVNGIQCAHQTKTNRDGKVFSEYELSDIKVLEKLEDTLFAQPVSKKP
jgi:hypothetical protein